MIDIFGWNISICQIFVFLEVFIFSELDDYEVFHPPPVDSTGADPIVNLIHLVTAGGIAIIWQIETMI